MNTRSHPRRPPHGTRLVTVLLLTLGLCGAALANQAAAPPSPKQKFSLRAAEQESGSNISRRLASNWSVPLDRTWEEMSPEHRRIWSSQYQGMGPSDEPPFPRRGLQSIHRAFERHARSHVQSSGFVEMHVEVDAEGVAKEIRVLSSPGDDVTRVMAAILLFETYKPARCDGQPCAMAFPICFELSTKLW